MLDALFYLLAFLLVSFSSATAGTVTVLQPLDEQLPLIARVNNSFSWSFSPTTFNPSDGSLKYTTSTLPTWLSFDGAARTFSGTPAPSDEGFPEITVTAHGHDSSTSSRFFLCVSSVAAPTMKKSIPDQFTPDNPSMSSVFYPRPGSVLSSSTVPVVRIPRKWSFSLGFDGKMFYGPNDNLAYDLRFANGSALSSDFLVWNAKTVTLDGVIPPPERMPQPTRLSLLLSVTDQEGYSAARLPFEIVVADHELSQTGGPAPTLNVTATAPFNVNLLTALNLSTILVDDQPIQPANISSLELDVFQAQDKIQARYDNNTKILSGTPPNDAAGMTTTFPVSVSTTFGQTLQTNLTLALIPSFFAFSDIPSIHIKRGEELRFNLAHWFAHPDESPTNVNISLTYDPPKAANWVHYDPSTTNLTGSFPLEYDDETDHVSVVFTAASLATGATSKTTLYIYIAGTGQTNLTHPSGLSTESRKQLVLALAVTFSILGGICLLTGIFAMIRRWARMEDTAVMGEEGRHAWSEKDRQWYGMMLSPNGTRVIEKPPTSNSPTSSFPQPRRSGSRPNFGSLGMGLRRALERSRSDLHGSSNAQSSGVMSKKDFVARLRDTMRQASDKYIGRTSPPRPTIGKPILIHPHGDEGVVGPAVSYPSTLSPQQGGLDSRPGSTFTSGSPSGSAGEHSIPRRRADFAPPRGLAQVHFADNGELMRQVSSVSIGASVRSGISGESYLDSAAGGPPSRPRLVPFNPSRVPVPFPGVNSVSDSKFTGHRITSQQAKVCKVNSQNGELESVKQSGSHDELAMGIHYVRSLGADQLAVNGSTEAGSSSPAISHSATSDDFMKILVRAGERFKFRLPLAKLSPQTSRQAKGFYARLTGGQALPKFVYVDLSTIGRGVVEFTGMPGIRDLGETSIGIYQERDGVCVVTVVIEVVGKR